MSEFERYYSEYMNTREGFDKFHNEVINMPRDSFSNVGFDKLRILAGYLLLTEGKFDATGVNYRDVMESISEELTAGNYPPYRSENLESRYFIDANYETQGRMFRHLMGLCAFFGLIASLTRRNKIIKYDKCREYYKTKDYDILMSVARNNFVTLNVSENDYIKSLSGISITADTDYRPSYAILKYMREISRPVTVFEISVLLGRIDKVKTENDILNRALTLGRFFDKSQQEQICYFFSNMNWKNGDGSLFTYAASQEPHFKFNSYVLFLEAFKLIEREPISDTYTLTSYSRELLDDDISYYIADLERLLSIIDDEDADNRELNDVILNQRQPELTRFVASDPKFIKKMNARNLKRPLIDRSGKKKRNRLIAELAKIQVDYKCQYTGKHTFKTPNEKYYCESHHIIEFSTENGPDITENMVVLGPEAHARIHRGNTEVIDEVFKQLIYNSAITNENFEIMANVYKCLTEEHVNVLHRRRIITVQQKEKLLELLSS